MPGIFDMLKAVCAQKGLNYDEWFESELPQPDTALVHVWAAPDAASTPVGGVVVPVGCCTSCSRALLVTDGFLLILWPVYGRMGAPCGRTCR